MWGQNLIDFLGSESVCDFVSQDGVHFATQPLDEWMKRDILKKIFAQVQKSELTSSEMWESWQTASGNPFASEDHLARTSLRQFWDIVSVENGVYRKRQLKSKQVTE